MRDGGAVLILNYIIKFFVLPTPLVFIALNSWALSEAEIYQRCYVHLTGRPVPLKSDVLKKVKNGQALALSSCFELLDQVSLNENGSLKSKTPETLKILNNFYDLHRTWFSVNTVDQMGFSKDFGIGTEDIYDSTQPALSITKSLFDEQGQYKNVVTSNKDVRAMREENGLVRSKIGWAVSFPGRRWYGNNADFDVNKFSFRNPENEAWDNGKNSVESILPKVAVGELVGITVENQQFEAPNFSLKPLANSNRNANNEPNMIRNWNIFENWGGGVIGSPIYFMLNYGQDLGVQANGTTKLARRWSQANFNSLMCRTLPSLRETDVRPFLDEQSDAPFRRATSCLQCHASMDQMASVARNIILGQTDFSDTFSRKTSILAARYNPINESVLGWPSTVTPNFHLQKPNGKLFFRSFNGELINKSVSGFQQLGEAIASTNDYYMCAVKKYYQYLTGINIPLYDWTDPANAALNKALSAEDKARRIQLQEWAAELKQNQSLKQVIKKIMSSEDYQK